MTQKQKCFVIDIDWDAPDGGYSILKSKRVIQYLLKNIKEGNNLIQTCKPFSTHKTKLCLKAKTFKKWNITPEWNEIECTHVNHWLKVSPCTIGASKKMFIRYKSNENAAGFAIYLLMIMAGEITELMHLEFVSVLKKMTTCIIHNEDVNWFHIKQI
jgi:hypothetical protein